MDLKNYIRDIPDFPRPGILFRDITPLLMQPAAFRYAIDQLAEQCHPRDVDTIVSIESRGFLFAAPLAYRMDKPLVPVRKSGKLPYQTYAVTYDLEYGTDTVEVHTDAISRGQRVLIIDDLLATGGTMAAAAKLVGQTGGQVVCLAVLIELADLKGRERLKEYETISLIQY